ncbi:MAG: hypothetical protein NXI21_07065 [Alphaproteobacteria bacterium]|nr:hypothetical protein [Alphaproteobacteria bacterium]
MRAEAIQGGAESGAPMNESPRESVSTGPGALQVDHPNVLSVQRELSLDQNRWRYGLVIVTDLSLDPGDPAHSPVKLDEMVRAVIAAARQASVGYDVLTLRNGV